MNQQTMSENNEQIDPQFFIAKYWSPILEHKLIVLSCMICGLMIATPLSMLVQPEYSSTATTQLEAPRAKMISEVTEEITSRAGDTAYITATVERMNSSAFRTEVLKVIPEQLQTDLSTPLSIQGQLITKLKPYIKNALRMESVESDSNAITPQRLISLNDRIVLQANSRNSTIQITGHTFDQTMATVLVKSYIDVLVALNMETNKSLIRHELEFTKEQRQDYYTQLKNAENELRLFKQKYEIPPALTSVTDMELQSQLDVLQNKLANTSERYKRIDDIYLELSRKEKAVVNNIIVINPPQVPINPSKNPKLTIILLGLILGAAVGIAPILVWDYYRGNIRHKKDITNSIDIPIIGTLPTIK